MIFKRILTKIIRIFVSFVCIFVTCFERASEWFMNLNCRTEYVRAGKCKQCGECCRLLAIYVPKPLRRFNGLIKMWHKTAYNFNFQFEEDGWNIYSCGHIKEDGHCGYYPYRFRICREFPKPKYYGRPYIHRNCGFYFVRRDGKVDFEAVMREKLNKHND